MAWDEAQSVKKAAEQAEHAARETEREAQEVERLGFRSFDADSIKACYFASDRVTFIAVGPDGPIGFANNARMKRAILRSPHTVLVAWPGEWRQDVFLLSEADKAAVLERLA